MFERNQFLTHFDVLFSFFDVLFFFFDVFILYFLLFVKVSFLVFVLCLILFLNVFIVVLVILCFIWFSDFAFEFESQRNVSEEQQRQQLKREHQIEIIGETVRVQIKQSDKRRLFPH